MPRKKYTTTLVEECEFFNKNDYICILYPKKKNTTTATVNTEICSGYFFLSKTGFRFETFHDRRKNLKLCKSDNNDSLLF